MNQRRRTIDPIWARREGGKAIRLIERLISHTTFLDQARERKTKQGILLAREHEIILQARDAERDARDLAAVILRLTAHLNNAGTLDGVLGYWTQRIDSAGPTKVVDIWAQAVDDFHLFEHLQSVGLSDFTIQWLANQLGRVDFTLGVNSSGELTVRSDGAISEVVITATPKPGQAKSISDLLFARVLETSAAALLEPGKVVAPIAPFRIIEDGKARINIDDALTAGALVYVHEFARQRRQVEDVGLPILQGNQWDIIIAIGIAIFVAGVILGVICSTTSESEVPSIVNDDRPVCRASLVLLLISAPTVAGAVVAESAARGLESQQQALWELRVGDIPAYHSTVQGGL
jgi:hypothetical protein